MAWVGQNNIRNYKFFQVKVDETFNIESRGGPGVFNRPQILYCFSTLRSLDYTKAWDGNLSLGGTYPNYKFTLSATDNNVDKVSSVINVLVFENENTPPIQSTTPKDGSWVTVATIGRIEIVDVSNVNGYTLDLDAIFGVGVFVRGNYHIMPIPKEITFGSHATGYDVSTQHLSGNRYKINLTTTEIASEPKITRYKGRQGTQVHVVDKDCLNYTFSMATVTSPNDTHIDTVYVKAYYGNNVLMERSYVYGTAFGAYRGLILKRDCPQFTAEWKASSRFDYNELVVIEYLCPTVVTQKAVISCLIIGGVT